MNADSCKEASNVVPFVIQKRAAYRHLFKHHGRAYCLFKRDDSRDASYYVHFQFRKRRYLRSLQTNDRAAAVDRAKYFIDDVFSGKLGKAAPSSAATIGDALGAYQLIAMVAKQTARSNISCLRQIVRLAFGDKRPPESIRLDELSWSVIAKFQHVMVADYLHRAPADDVSQREARDRALRTSKSMIAQARSIFSRQKDLPRLYAERGIEIPAGVVDFMTCRVHGRMVKREYLSPPDSVVRAAFDGIEEVKDIDRNAYLAFWFAVGAGLRRKEIQQLCWEHLIEREGHVWVSGTIGKNGEKVEVPMQSRAVAAVDPFRQPVGRVMGAEMGVEWARRLNLWLRRAGWRSEKKMHELRAYIGSMLYQANPLFAMKFMRHSSIRITEQFYCRYGKPLQPIDVL